MDLPTGLTHRPLTPADLDATFAVYAAAEIDDCGTLDLELEDIESSWAKASFDLTTQSIGVFEGDVLVGSAEVLQGRRAEAAVHPSHQGRGIGGALAQWTEQIARRDGGDWVGQTRFVGSNGERLLRSRGYETRWTSWVLELPPDTPIQQTPLPQGYAVREFRCGEEQLAYQLVEDAFNEWPDRSPQAYADWEPQIIGRRGFAPWQIRLATAPDGTPVGAACTILDGADQAYIHQLAVRADQRGKGLARALMADAFREGREHGAHRFGLSTDSRTGALGLYENVGMEVTQTWVQLACAV